MKKKTEHLRFKGWIDNYGQSKLAIKLKVTRGATNAWSLGIATPNAQLMPKLVALGRGAFTYEDIIKDTIRNKNPMR